MIWVQISTSAIKEKMLRVKRLNTSLKKMEKIFEFQMKTTISMNNLQRDVA